MTAEEAMDDAINNYPGIVPTTDYLLAALSAAGFAVVPRETVDNAAHRLAMSDFSIDRECGAELAAMLAAAQTPPADIPASGPQTARLCVKPDF